MEHIGLVLIVLLGKDSLLGRLLCNIKLFKEIIQDIYYGFL